jgi:hypothetical protein
MEFASIAYSNSLTKRHQSLSKREIRSYNSKYIKNEIYLSLVKISYQYNIPFDILKKILKDKKIMTRFHMTFDPKHFCNIKLTHTKIKMARSIFEYPYKCYRIHPDTCGDPGWICLNFNSKVHKIEYIKQYTSFKQNGGKLTHLNKMTPKELMGIIIHSPLCQ